MFNDYYKGKKVLVTGHTGFKGSWLSIWLKLLGAKVYGFSLKPIYRPNNYTISGIGEKIESEKIGDIRNCKVLNKFILNIKPDIVFHLAAQPLVITSYNNPRLTYEVNIIGLINLLEILRKTNFIKNIVIITSDKCYENLEKNISYKESDKLGGKDPYSSSKACAEIIAKAYYNSFFKDKKVFISTVRAGNVIGGGDWSDYRIVPDCIRSIFEKKPLVIRNPHSFRPWQHVLEPLSGYLLLASMLSKNKIFNGESWNFGPKPNVKLSVLDLVNNLCNELGTGKIKINTTREKYYESKYLNLNISKAREFLNWEPIWSMNTTIKKTAEWYKEYYINKGNMYNFCIKQIKEYVLGARSKGLNWTK